MFARETQVRYIMFSREIKGPYIERSMSRQETRLPSKVLKYARKVTGYVAIGCILPFFCCCRYFRVESCVCNSQVPLNALREIKLLKLVSHRNIVKLRDIVCNNRTYPACFRCINYEQPPNTRRLPPTRYHVALEEATGIHLIFEYMDHDMTGLMHVVKVGHIINVHSMHFRYENLDFCLSV